MNTHTALRIGAIFMLKLITSPSLAQDFFQMGRPGIAAWFSSTPDSAKPLLYQQVNHYDKADRLVEIERQVAAPEAGKPLNTRRQKYTYDKMERLTGIASSDGADSTFHDDPAGNRIAGASPLARQACLNLVDQINGTWSLAVSRPGQYCVTQDLHQIEPPPWLRLPHQPGPTSPLLTISSSGAAIDLGGHQLIARLPSALGIWLNRGGSIPLRHVRVANGRVVTEKQPTVFMVHAWNRKNKRFSQYSSVDAIASSEGDIEKYQPTEFILENLTLEGDNQVIIMHGMKNTIRHCKIIGGTSTVNVFGPQLTFEDNEIILHAKSLAYEPDDVPVALYLEDAANSVVRNNRITIKGNTPDSEAIVLRNSPNVTLQGNTVSGTDALYKRLDEQSSVIATDNHLNR